MANLVRCPRCQGEFPQIVATSGPRACPRCRARLDGETSRTSSRNPQRILKARPAPTPEVESRAGRAIFAAVAVVFLALGLLGYRALSNPGASEGPNVTPAGETTVAEVPGSSVSSTTPGAASLPGKSAPRPPEVAAVEKKAAPRVRVIRAESVPEIETASYVTVRKAAAPPPAVEGVDQAIRRGVEFLRRNPALWIRNDQHDVGYAALPGLALLEAGVTADDRILKAAAAHVRFRAGLRAETYEVALALLFLDRLGDPQDEMLIRRLAIRLIAAQTKLGGWNYRCTLPAEQEAELLRALESARPAPPALAPTRRLGQGLAELAIPIARSDRTKTSDTEPSVTREALAEVPERFRELPVFRETLTPATGFSLIPELDLSFTPVRQDDDNSNSQFALLALWAARRHGVPVERSLLLADRRFARMQATDGTWSYRGSHPGGSAAMTCVGLLGLALGHGAVLPAGAGKAAPNADDPAIRRGLEAVARSVGDPTQSRGVPEPSLYFLWSLERVAMLYQLPTIGGKDWYGWGARLLVQQQGQNGAWFANNYPGSDAPIDTAFALLFLHRSNLVQDLTERLQLHLAISDSTGK